MTTGNNATPARRDDHGHSPSIVLYSHDGFGLGHLRRTVRIAQQLRRCEPNASVLLVTSSPAAGHPFIPEEFEFIKLPSVTKTEGERYRPHLQADLKTIIALRAALLLTTVQQLQPDLLVVDHRPLGLKREVLPTLEWIKENAPHIRTAVGLRDVVDAANTVKHAWSIEGIYEALDSLYDAVLVYGERSILDITVDYAFPDPLARKVRFTGYFENDPPRLTQDEVRRSLSLAGERLVVVHVGGGGDGSHLIGTYLDTLHLLPDDVHSHIVTGPLMPSSERDRLRREACRERVSFVEYQDDLTSIIAAADVSVSMGGYNTMCELLAAGIPALVVPRVFPRQEQFIRAERMAERGLITLVPSTSLDPGVLARGVRKGLAQTKRRSIPPPMHGLECTARFLLALSGASPDRGRERDAAVAARST